MFLVCVQILIIGFLYKEIQRRQVLGTTSITTIEADTIVTTKSGTLTYFYEPKPDTIIKPEIIIPGLENVTYHINDAGFHQLHDYPKEK